MKITIEGNAAQVVLDPFDLMSVAFAQRMQKLIPEHDRPDLRPLIDGYVSGLKLTTQLDIIALVLTSIRQESGDSI